MRPASNLHTFLGRKLSKSRNKAELVTIYPLYPHTAYTLAFSSPNAYNVSTMSSESGKPWEINTRDPLSPVTRAERRALIAASAIVIAIARTGLVPTKISALGVDFGPADQRAFLSVLALVILYFSAAFAVYAAADLVAWRVALRQSFLERASEFRKLDLKAQLKEHNAGVLARADVPIARVVSKLSTPVIITRATFDFALPIFIAAYALVLLLNTHVPARPTQPNNSGVGTASSAPSQHK